MSQSWRSLLSLPLAAAVACTPLVATTALVANGADAPASKAAPAKAAQNSREPIRVQSYAKADGSNYFALSLQAAITATPSAGTDVVVLFDTSASQVGKYREKALEALGTLVGQLGASDRVQLIAVDLDGTALSKTFVAPGSEAYKQAIAALQRRTPLGSTDMVAAVKSAVAAFDAKSQNRHAVVYIGDGISNANLGTAKQMVEAIAQLVKSEAAMSCLAIGPKRDEAMLAALANQSGGMLALDGDKFSAADAGKYLASAAKGLVAWPVAASFPAGVEVFPVKPIPFRLDRDTVFIGTGKLEAGQKIEVTANVNGQSTKLAWTVPAVKANDGNVYLTKLVESSRADRGASLATIGSDGLQIARQITERSTDFLADQARQAVAAGNVRGASPILAELRRIDPSHPELRILKAEMDKLIKQRNEADAASAPASSKTRGEAKAVRPSPFMFAAYKQDEAPADAPADAAEEAAPEGAAPEVAAPEVVPPAAEAAVDPAPGSGNLIQDAEIQTRRENELVAKETEVEINDARRIMRTNPQQAIENLKLQLDHLENHPDLYPENRAQLMDKVTVAVRQAERTGASLEEENAIRQAAVGAAQERQRIQAGLLRDQEKVKQYVEQFRVLLDEGSYEEADESIAPQVDKIMPDTALATSLHEVARSSESYRSWQYIYGQHVKRMNQELLQVDTSAIPFPDNIPIIYPSAEVWEDLTNRRKQYASVDLQKKGSAEEKIFRALSETAELELIQMPLEQFAEQIKSQHKIEVQLDRKALQDAGVDPAATEITRNLRGISLRSALRLILKELDLTYIIQNEVLLITTPDKATTALTTKVYPVADLVLKIKDIGFSGGLSGSLGGFGGFGGGGGGGGAGDAFGGGGGGGVGGGGAGF